MNVKTILLFIIVPIIICSCGNKISGEIEIREKDKVYLVNKSPEKTYKFTVKMTALINDTSYKYETDQIQLAPGDEKYIGKTKVIKIQPDLSGFNDAVKAYDEGKIILPKGAVLINTDSAKKPITTKEEYNYEVTGQLEIKYGVKKDNSSN